MFGTIVFKKRKMGKQAKQILKVHYKIKFRGMSLG